jgi:hypothetical protein
MAKRLKPKLSTVKALFANSGNRCAFPNCNQKLVDDEGNVIGQICHIEAAKEGGERFNENQTDEQRRAYDNLILLCPTHHVLTDNVKNFPVPKLKSMKLEHEEKVSGPTYKISDDIAKKAIQNFEELNIQNNLNSGAGTQYNIQGDYLNNTQEEVVEDLGVITEIFEYVLGKLNEGIGDDYKDNENIHVNDKISLNFPDPEHAEEVKSYFNFAYLKIKLITSGYNNLDTEDQKDISAFALYKYRELKSTTDTSIEILRKMVLDFTPETKRNNPKYLNLARAFVLFFFDDCTIFEKTVDEKTKQTKLFL